MNPINDYYNRYGQQMLPFPPRQNFPPVNCRFVTNVDEAKASMIDGYSYNLFVDTSTGKIYLKKMNNNGLSDFITYKVEEPEPPKDPLADINARLTNIESYLGGIKNDKSVSVPNQSTAGFNTTATEPHERNDETESAGVSKNAGNDFWKKRK